MFTPEQIKEIEKIVERKSRTDLFRFPKIPPHKHDGIDNIAVHEKDIIPVVASSGSITMATSQTYVLYFNRAGVTKIDFNGIALNTGGRTAVTFTGPFRAGDTTGVLTSVWGGSSQTLVLNFSSGESRAAVFTNSSLTVTWTTVPLAKSASATAYYDASSVRALVVGSAQLTKTFYFQPVDTASVSTGGTPYPQDNVAQHLNAVPSQSSSSIYIDSTNVANTRARVSQFHIVDVFTNSGGSVAQATVFNVLPESVSVSVSLASGWSITGNWVMY